MYTAVINGITLEIETAPELFSPSAPDNGTLAMLAETEILPTDRVLDLGCGCGIVGIYAAKIAGGKNVIMCDIVLEAVKTARRNAARNGVAESEVYLSDGFDSIPEHSFSLILSNPPYHADFSVAKRFIKDGYERLETGGQMVMVTKRLDWYKNRFKAVFGGVRVVERDGYYIFTAEKRGKRMAAEKPLRTMSKKLARKYKIKPEAVLPQKIRTVWL